jgi:hypothetical protein
MTVTVNKFSAARKYLLDGTIDLDTDTIKVALVTSAYTFNAANTVWADISTNEASGPGYTAGGQALANIALTYDGSAAKFDADDTVWTSSTVTARWAIAYKSGTANGLTNPLLCAYLLDDTPADVSSSNADFTIQWHANGIFTLA